MNINKNPYVTLIHAMRDQGATYNPPSIELGKVISSSPLAVSVGDLQLSNNNLMINDYYKDKLNNNDLVALVQISDNAFLILCKVVSL